MKTIKETKYNEYRRKAAQLDKLMRALTMPNIRAYTFDGLPLLKSNEALQIHKSDDNSEVATVTVRTYEIRQHPVMSDEELEFLNH